MIKTLFLLVLISTGLIMMSSLTYAENVRSIQVIGTQRIEPDAVTSALSIRAGDPITAEMMSDGVNAVFATGFFEDVSITQSAGVLTVKVLENPIINQIAFEGNKKIKDKDLETEIALRPRQVLSRSAVQEDVDRMAEIYRRRGRYAATITPKIIRLDQNRVNLVFEIVEGPKTGVSRLAFVGNKAYSDSKLREEIITRQSVWYRFLSASDRYDPDQMEGDKEKLREFYLAHGYPDMAVIAGAAELSEDRKHFFITYTIEEGQRQRIKDVVIESALQDVLDTSFLKSVMKVKKGQWYDVRDVRKSADAITDELGARQHNFVNVTASFMKDPTAKDLHGTLIFRITPAPRAFVERIEISGNSRTLDTVIRREMMLVEGDPLNKDRLSRSRQNIQDLGYFETVEVRSREGSSPENRVIEVVVKEKSTGEVSVGAGYSTIDGALADFRIRERNLGGRGYDSMIAMSIAQESTQFNLSLTDPRFLGRDLALGGDVFHITRDLQDESSFDQTKTGGAVRMGYPLSENWRQTLKYRIENNDITDVQDDASTYIKEQEGERLTSAVSQRLVYDKRDSTLNPTEGWFYWLDAEASGLGGDSQYVSSRTGASAYYPVREGWVVNIIGEGGAVVGYGDEDPAINERYYMGGETMRGFAKGGIGPRDLITSDALGGQYFLRGTAELSMPTFMPKDYGVKGHVFSDIGTLWGLEGIDDPNIKEESAPRVSIGIGFSWDSPMGPIRADLSKAIVKEDYDETEAFRFSFGTRF